MAVIPERQAPAPPAENLAWLLAQASHALTIEMTAALEDLGLSPRGHCVLSTAMTGEFTQTELAHAIGLDKTTMVVTMDDLEAKGLAERRPSKADRRARVIALTKAGEKKVAQGAKLVERVQAEVLEGLPAQQRLAFMSALGSLVSGRLSEPCECDSTVRRRN